MNLGTKLDLTIDAHAHASRRRSSYELAVIYSLAARWRIGHELPGVDHARLCNLVQGFLRPSRLICPWLLGNPT